MTREGDNTVQLATRVPKALHLRARREAILTEVTLAEWVEDALRAHLARGQRQAQKAAEADAG